MVADEFRTLAQTYFAHALTAPDEVTDAEIDRATELVARLRRDGTVVETLSPLLTDDDPAVRFGAASFLIEDGVPEAAEALREIAGGAYGLVSDGARAALHKRG